MFLLIFLHILMNIDVLLVNIYGYDRFILRVIFIDDANLFQNIVLNAADRKINVARRPDRRRLSTCNLLQQKRQLN